MKLPSSITDKKSALLFSVKIYFFRESIKGLLIYLHSLLYVSDGICFS